MKATKISLERIGLNQRNSIVIGSGILEKLGIRKTKDIDLVTTQQKYDFLEKSGKFNVEKKHGRELLKNYLFHIGPNWFVLGKWYELKDLLDNSMVIDGVRYITLNFLYKVKKNWLLDKNVSQKDINDVKLIEKYISKIKG